MALTKISRGLIDTGVADTSDATAITINASENITFANTAQGTIITGTTSIRTPLIEYSDGDDAIVIADGGDITIPNDLAVTGAVDINGGAIDGTVIGGASTAAGSFTTLGASGTATLSGAVNVGGALTVTGDLTVNGTTTTINSTTMTVDDLNLVLASGAGSSAAADGAGITIDGAAATMLYTHSTTSFDFNKPVNVAGIIKATTSVRTPLIEYTDGDDAITIADGGDVTLGGHISLVDNKIIKLGTGSDLQIYHSSSNNKSYIKESGASNLVIATSALELNNAADSENMIVANEDGAVTLFYNNVGKIATTSGGAAVTGILTVSSHLTVDGNTTLGNTDSDTVTLPGPLAVDTDTLYVDVTNDRVGINVGTTPSTALQVGGTVTATAFAGPLTGNVTGNVTGNTSGTAATVTTAAQPAITSLGTLTTLTVDDITINGSTISDGGDFTLDVGGDIILDAAGGNTLFKLNGTTFLDIQVDSNNAELISRVDDADIKFRGRDGSSTITALTLDMSEAGAATFNAGITATTYTGALASTVTATTQSTNDNTTKVATTAWVQTELTDLIDGAPGTLDTLNELAAAINDDANYNSTLTTALATKLPLAGGTMTGNLTISNTDVELILNDTNSTPFGIRSNGGVLDIRNSNSGEIGIKFTNNADVVLYYNNVAKLYTHGSGTQLVGDLGIGAAPASFGSGVSTLLLQGTAANSRAGAINFQEQDGTVTTQIYSTDGSDGYGTVISAAQGDMKFSTGSLTGYKMVILSGGNVGIGTTAPAELLTLKAAGNEENMILFEDNSATDIGTIGIHPSNGFVVQQKVAGASVHLMTHDGNEDINLDSDGFIQFEAAGSEKMRITSTGVGIGVTPDVPLTIQTNDSTTNTAVNTLMIRNLSTGTTTTGFGGEIRFQAERNNGVNQNTGGIRSIAEVNSGADISSGMAFDTSAAGVNSEKLRITYDGKVGIGTTTPEGSTAGSLTIAGTSSGSQFIARTNESTAAQRAGGGFSSTGHATATSRRAHIWLDADGGNWAGSDYFYIVKDGNSGDTRIVQQGDANMDFQTNGTLRQRIDNDGNVQFGPHAADIQIKPHSINSGHGEIYMRGNASNERSSIVLNHYGHADFRIQAGAVGNGKFSIGNADADPHFVMLTSGNVGIGTASPDQNLHVHKGSAGSVDSSADSVLTLESNDHAILQFLTPADKVAQVRFGDPSDNGNGWFQYDHNTLKMQWGTNGPTKMTLDSSGNLGIGTASPTTSKLQVHGSNGSAGAAWTAIGPGNIPGVTIANDSTTNNTMAGLFFATSSTPNIRGGLVMNFVNVSHESRLGFATTASNGNTREHMGITGSGNVGIGSKLNIGSNAISGPTAISGELLRLDSAGDNTPLISMVQGNARLASIGAYYSSQAASYIFLAPPEGSTDRTAERVFQFYGDGKIDIRDDAGTTRNFLRCDGGGYGFVLGGLTYNATSGTGNIHSMHMIQSGKITFGDWSDANPIGICEGDWNEEGTDRDYITIAGRNSIRFLGNSNAEKMRLVTGGTLSIGTTGAGTNAKLNVAGGINYTHSPASAAGLNVVAQFSFNNSNTSNACGSVYYKCFYINFYHNNGHSQCLFLANGGGGVGYNFTGIVPGNTSLVTGTGINTSFTTIGSSPNTFQVQISSGGGALTVSRTSGTGSFQVSIQVMTGG